MTKPRFIARQPIHYLILGVAMLVLAGCGGIGDGSNGSSALTSNLTASSSNTTGNGTATVSWLAPTQNTDGSALTNLTGFRIFYGTNASNLTQTVQISDPTASTYTVQNLPAGTWYFAMTAYSSTGTESSASSIGSKIVP